MNTIVKDIRNLLLQASPYIVIATLIGTCEYTGRHSMPPSREEVARRIEENWKVQRVYVRAGEIDDRIFIYNTTKAGQVTFDQGLDGVVDSVIVTTNDARYAYSRNTRYWNWELHYDEVRKLLENNTRQQSK
jgi:hypothetical protein